MFHIIEGLGEAGQQPLLDAMFEARKRLFVDLLDWDLETVDGRLEIDRFDDAFATYVIVTDNARRHLASLRLLPSTRPHRSEEHTSELQSLMSNSYAVFCLKKKKN